MTDILEKFKKNVISYMDNNNLCESEFHKINYLIVIGDNLDNAKNTIISIIDEKILTLQQNLLLFLSNDNLNLDILIDKIKEIDFFVKSNSNKITKLFAEYENNIFNKELQNKYNNYFILLSNKHIFDNNFKNNTLITLLINNLDYSSDNLKKIFDILKVIKYYNKTITCEIYFLHRLLNELSSEIIYYNNNLNNIVNYLEMIINISNIVYDKDIFIDNYIHFLKKRILLDKYNIEIEHILLKKIESLVGINLEKNIMLHQILNDLIINKFIEKTLKNKINYVMVRKENWKELYFDKEIKFIDKLILPLQDIITINNQQSLDSTLLKFKNQFKYKRFYYDYYHSTVLIDLDINNKKYSIKMTLIEYIILSILNENYNTAEKIYKYLEFKINNNILMYGINNLIHHKILIIDDNIEATFKFNQNWKSNYSKISFIKNYEYV